MTYFVVRRARPPVTICRENASISAECAASCTTGVAQPDVSTKRLAIWRMGGSILLRKIRIMPINAVSTAGFGYPTKAGPRVVFRVVDATRRLGRRHLACCFGSLLAQALGPRQDRRLGGLAPARGIRFDRPIELIGNQHGRAHWRTSCAGIVPCQPARLQ